MPQNHFDRRAKKVTDLAATWTSGAWAFFITIPARLRPSAKGLLSTKAHSLFFDLSVALGLLLAACLARLLVDPILSGRLPFITFFPALLAVAIFCRLGVAVGFAVTSAVIGSLLWDAPRGVAVYYQFAGSILFILIGTVIVAMAEGLKDAYTQIAVAEERLRTINGELMHRIRNLLQISSVIVSQSAKTASNAQEVEKAILGRLAALSAAQTVALTGAGDAPLARVIDVVLSPLSPGPDRLSVSGPHFTLPGPVMTMLALVLHELGTNALKYGAWSDQKGIVEVRWRKADGALTLEWIERNGPPVDTPKRVGAGSKLICNAIPQAVIDYSLEHGGARCRIEFPSAALTAPRRNPG